MKRRPRLGSVTAHQKADDATDQCGDADRAPWIFLNVLIRPLRKVFGLVAQRLLKITKPMR